MKPALGLDCINRVLAGGYELREWTERQPYCLIEPAT